MIRKILGRINQDKKGSIGPHEGARMNRSKDFTQPSKDGFGQDPLGYGALGWHKWAMVQTLAGFDVDMPKGPSSEDLKSPVLWLSHAHAMSEAARVLIQGSPNLDPIPREMRGVCHCQYHGIALMLVGYSLEICLKAMLIIKNGVSAYQDEEKKYFHHSLDKLADFVPELSAKDKATLKALSHFVSWAGRYPDPGFGKESHAEEIFTLSELHQISAKDLFSMVVRVTRYVEEVLGEKS